MDGNQQGASGLEGSYIVNTGNIWRCAILALVAAEAGWAGDIVVQVSNPIGGDLVDWSQLGGDLTAVPQNFTATSLGGLNISGSFAGGPGGSDGGLTAVVCPETICSWVTSGTGVSAGDTMLVTTDGETANGPLTLTFENGNQALVGAELQSDATGAFTGQIEVLNGLTVLATFTQASDANGDPVFLGASDQTGANITSVEFSMTVAPDGGDVNDFAIDSLQIAPEPGSMTLAALAAFAGLAWRFRRRLAFAASLLCLSALSLFAQSPFTSPFGGTGTTPAGPYPLAGAQPSTATIPLALQVNQTAAQAGAALSANVSNIPLWSYSAISSRDGRTYSGLMVGRNPSNRLATTTTVPVKIIPIAWQFVVGNTTYTYDPTLPDPCSPRNPATDTALGLTTASPLFQPNTYVYGGTTVGTNTQFHDAWQRANFWSLVSRTGNSYHTVMNVQVLPTFTIVATQNFWIGTVTGTSGNCTGLATPVGVVNLAAWDSYLQSTILPAYASYGVNSSNLPLFLFYNTFLQSPFNPGGACCILGYHSAISAGLNLAQTYATSAYNSSGAFGITSADTATLTHELGEWMDDPIGNNPTPSWGHIGQVNGCQGNLEVGDPLSGTLMPTITSNGFTYHMQELAFYSWFLGAPSTGVNGWFSSNGTFATDAGGVCQ